MFSQKALLWAESSLIGILLVLLPGMAEAADAGTMAFVAGPVTAIDAAGMQRVLRKGAEINSGDIVQTGEEGRAQLRFSDGALVSLQPLSEFRVDEYRYAGKPDGEEKGFFSLLKGGFRTVTGWVGRGNRSAYRVTTSVATIGIRGTEYSASLDAQSGALSVATAHGAVEVCNIKGCVVLNAGESALVSPENEPARRSDAQPHLPPRQWSGGATAVFAAGSENQLQSGIQAMAPAATPIVQPAISVGGIDPSLAISFAYDNMTPVYNGDGSLKQFSSTSQGTAAMVDYGGDSIIHWGAWSNGTISLNGGPMTLSANQSMPLYWGTPTAVMPTTGSFTYSLLGGPRPTEIAGAFSPGTLNGGSLSVNFGSGSLSASLDVAIGGYSYSVLGSGMVSGNAISIPSVGVLYMAGLCSGCFGAMSGQFFGPNAARAGLSYTIADPNPGAGVKIIGAAAFAQ